MRKTFLLCLVALFALLLGSCSKKEHAARVLVKDVNDSVMNIENDGSRVDVDMRKAIYTAGAIQGGDPLCLTTSAHSAAATARPSALSSCRGPVVM